MRIGFLALVVIASVGTATAAAAQDDEVDRAGEAAVDAELGGPRPRASEPRERGRKRTATTREPERSPEPAAAPRRRKPISLSLLLGYGFDLEDEFAANPWRFGFGALFGYNAGPLFLGGRFVFYLGEDPSNVWEIGLEGGYDIKDGVVTVRPGIGFGLASVVIDALDESESDAYVAPSLALLLDVTRDVFVGVDGRVQFILSEPEGLEAIILLGNIGMRF